jgi:hypothetical protein
MYVCLCVCVCVCVTYIYAYIYIYIYIYICMYVCMYMQDGHVYTLRMICMFKCLDIYVWCLGGGGWVREPWGRPCPRRYPWPSSAEAPDLCVCERTHKQLWHQHMRICTYYLLLVASHLFLAVKLKHTRTHTHTQTPILWRETQHRRCRWRHAYSERAKGVGEVHISAHMHVCP